MGHVEVPAEDFGGRHAGPDAIPFLAFGCYLECMSVATKHDDLPSFLAAAGVAVRRGEPLVLAAGGEAHELPSGVGELLLRLLEGAASGRSIEITTLPDEMTTGQAADLLGVSRPTVVALVDGGAIAGRKVGTHRRVLTSDVIGYRERQRNERSSAVNELLQLSQQLGAYD